MTTYKGIKGLGIQNITSDAVADQGAGGTWASGDALNSSRGYVGSAGIVTAALSFGGTTTPPVSYRDENESYDGTSWTEVSELNTARSAMASAGTQTAA